MPGYPAPLFRQSAPVHWCFHTVHSGIFTLWSTVLLTDKQTAWLVSSLHPSQRSLAHVVQGVALGACPVVTSVAPPHDHGSYRREQRQGSFEPLIDFRGVRAEDGVSPCNEGLEDSDGTCEVIDCGDKGEACCAGDSCNMDTLSCSAGTCLPCGTVGLRVCTGAPPARYSRPTLRYSRPDLPSYIVIALIHADILPPKPP